MVHIAIESDKTISVPFWVTDIHKFREWAHSDEFPELRRIWWLVGEVWVDITMEQIFSHVAVKTEYTSVLHGLAKKSDQGRYVTDGVFLSNVAADIAGIPDGLFVSHKSLELKRVRFLEGGESGFIELEGSPDMVLEIVSRSSVNKDTIVLKKAYWEAGVREYWLVDARKEPLSFTIFRYTARGFSPARKVEGWSASNVFGKSFRLVQEMSARNQPEFTLQVR
jgi:Uma2 family endonuclease